MPGDSTSFDHTKVMKNTVRNDSYIVVETYPFTASNIASLTGAVLTGGVSFQFSDVPSSSAWATVFDRYKFLSVEVHFIPIGLTENVLNPSGGVSVLPVLHTAVDFDDAATTATITALQKYSTYAGVPGNQSLVRKFVPHVAALVYNNASPSGYLDLGNPFVDMENLAIPHYGLKYALDTSSVAGMATYQPKVTVKILVAGRR